MKLKDFNNDPKKYEEIKAKCRSLNIEPDDEMEVSEILAAMNSKSARLKMKAQNLAKAADKKRRQKGLN
ncbi:MAG: hypothetical protein AWU54_1946 [Candidatus Frackibacter sp. T328-2]|nr:MAG: hypothetical protein AWU54_1946 [Candidatus Frackibacter sp. T328-2]